jgi:hypothetical protein
LKAVLLHNGNEYPSVPAVYAIQMKKTIWKYMLSCEILVHPAWQIFLAYLWRLKSDHTSPWLQLSYTKFCCFLHEWDSQTEDSQYVLYRTISTSSRSSDSLGGRLRR